jgi:electron transport complex protein RnfD
MMMPEQEPTRNTQAKTESPAPHGSGSAAPSEKQRPRSKAKADPRNKLLRPERPLIISSSPHQLTSASVPKIMWGVFLALLPATVMSVVYFGLSAVVLLAACTGGALVTEVVFDKMRGSVITIRDGSAAVTGLLLALTLPPTFAVSGAIIGSVFAITIGKQIFGGLGYNIFNPALLGRAFLQACFPVEMTTWIYPNTEKYANIDALSAATPLGQFKFEKLFTAYGDLFAGNIAGSLGETSAVALLVGGLFLLLRGYADWRITVSLTLTVVVFGGIFWAIAPRTFPDPLFHLLAGGFLLAAFFMATDPVTSPITPGGVWVFGIGAGFLLIIIRLFGGLPEGVMYSILLMNAVTPLINRYSRPKIFGERA